MDLFFIPPSKRDDTFFAIHPRFKRDRLERQKNHVYHVNPWPRPGIENTVFIIEFS